MSPNRRAVQLTSDSTRVQKAALIALASALGAGVGLLALAARGELAERRILSPPHARARVACASCHVQSDAPAQVKCAPCHVLEQHASTRAGHRRLAAEGTLGCATCHPAHVGFQALAFGKGAVERWGPGASITPARAGPLPEGQTVPLVQLSACGRCHTLLDPRDPAARCVPAARGSTWATTPSLCLDEHVLVSQPARPPSGKCGAQHGEAHLAALELAAEVASGTAWQERPPSRRSFFVPPGLAALFGLAALALLAKHGKGAKAAPVRLPAAEARRRLPRVDAATCLGCNACIEACPFDVLELETYVAKVARPDECCGAVLCAQVCPNGSLVIQEGEVIESRIATDEALESLLVPGIFVAGDLTGVPLIKNAIAQGDRVVRRIHEQLAKAPRAEVDADVLVIGGGPAGLAAALRAKGLGVSCLVLEQGSVAASIRSFPRGKIVHDPPLSLAVEGDLWLAEATKEELVAQWERIVRVRGLDVREGHRVTAAAREGDRFVVTAEGPGGRSTWRARRLVVAIGRRGTPRTVPLEVSEGASGKIHYSLADAASFAGKRVVIVGLGDTAMEAALALARQPGTWVTLVARATDLTRGKARNVAELRRAIRDRRLEVRFGARLVAVGISGVRLEDLGSGALTSVGNDAVFVLIGGLPSWDLLVRIGVARAEAPDAPK